MKKTAIINGIYVDVKAGKLLTDRTLIFDQKSIIYFDHTCQKSELTDCDIVDGRHRVYLPGLVNTHGHSAMSLLRGYSDDVALHDWFQKIWPLEARFDKPAIKAAALLSMAEMIKSGTTTFVDMYDNMDQVGAAVAESGLRGVLTRGINGLCDQTVWEAKLKEAIEFAKNWHGQCAGKITTMMSPHGPYTCPPILMAKIVEASHELNLPIHTHLSETTAEIELCIKIAGQRPVAYLKQMGALARPCLLAHAIHLTPDEIEILADHQVRISHNPRSNLKLGSGIAPLMTFLEKKMLVSLGTDSPASNNNLDLFEEMRLVATLHKGVTQNPMAVPAIQALQMATCDGARSLWLDHVGEIKVGMQADIIALNIDQPHFYPLQNLFSHLVYSASGHDVSEAWVAGRQLLKNRELLTLDEEKIKREFCAAYQRFFIS